MKWYFACNNQSPDYEYMIKAAVESALQNTSLQPHFLYDGTPDGLTAWLEEKGVTVIYHRASFYDRLKSFYTPEKLKTASGTFMRCDIPLIETTDERVLYTDCDVLFLKPIELADFPETPVFACATESWKDDWSILNTGVMLMNIPSLRKTHPAFKAYIESHLPELDVFDQSAYNLFYSGQSTKLPLEYNWKPYWGNNPQAKIIHFHGPKPHDLIRILRSEPAPDIYELLFKFNRSSSIYYLSRFCKYSGALALNPEEAFQTGVDFLSGVLLKKEAEIKALYKKLIWRRFKKNCRNSLQKIMPKPKS